MQESLSTIQTATPITVTLSPRDIFTLHAACEHAILDMDDCEFKDNELRTRMDDLYDRFTRLLKDGGHVK